MHGGPGGDDPIETRETGPVWICVLALLFVLFVATPGTALGSKRVVEILEGGEPLSAGAVIQAVTTFGTTPWRTEFCELTSQAEVVGNSSSRDVVAVGGDHASLCASPPPFGFGDAGGDALEAQIGRASVRIRMKPPRPAAEELRSGRCIYDFRNVKIPVVLPGPLSFGPIPEMLRVDQKRSAGNSCAAEAVFYIALELRDASGAQPLTARFAE